MRRLIAAALLVAAACTPSVEEQQHEQDMIQDERWQQQMDNIGDELQRLQREQNERYADDQAP